MQMALLGLALPCTILEDLGLGIASRLRRLVSALRRDLCKHRCAGHLSRGVSYVPQGPAVEAVEAVVMTRRATRGGSRVS